jgi:hypothetical protein
MLTLDQRLAQKQNYTSLFPITHPPLQFYEHLDQSIAQKKFTHQYFPSIISSGP